MAEMTTKTATVARPRAEQGYAVGQARREQIVREATLQFARAGFNGIMVRDIAAKCGISRTGPLHHFPTKEALLEAVLEERDVADRARFRSTGSAEGGGPAVLRGMVDLAAHNAELPGVIALHVVLSAEASAADHPAHDYFVRRYARIRRGTKWTLRKAAEAGHLANGVDVADAATELAALMDGLKVMWLLSPKTVDMAGQLRTAIQRLLVVPL